MSVKSCHESSSSSCSVVVEEKRLLFRIEYVAVEILNIRSTTEEKNKPRKDLNNFI